MHLFTVDHNGSQLSDLISDEVRDCVHGTYLVHWPFIKRQGLSKVRISDFSTPVNFHLKFKRITRNTSTRYSIFIQSFQTFSEDTKWRTDFTPVNHLTLRLQGITFTWHLVYRRTNICDKPSNLIMIYEYFIIRCHLRFVIRAPSLFLV